jgi:hypothetical protein
MTLLRTIEKSFGMLAVSASVANNLDISIFAGLSSDTVDIPRVVIASETAEEFIQDTGIFRVPLEVTVTEYATDNDETATSVSQTMFDAFVGNGIQQKISNYSTSSLTIYDIKSKDVRHAADNTDKTFQQTAIYELIASLTQ